MKFRCFVCSVVLLLSTFARPAADAKWISPPGAYPKGGVGELRRTFENAKPVRKAVWTMSGLGVYEARVNGTVVSGFLEPGFTDVLKCRHAFAHDVTAALRRGKGERNELAASASPGWWCDKIENGNYWKKRQGRPNGDKVRPAFRGELVLVYEDGGEERIVTDERWQGAWGGETTLAGIYEGEDCDFRRRGTEAFAPAVENVDFGGEIRPARNVPAVRRRDLALPAREAWVWKGVADAEGTNAFGRAVVLRRPAADRAMALAPGETLVVDFGQNAAFVPDVELEGAAGTAVTLKPGEILNDGNGLRSRGNDGPGGSVHRANYRGARSLAKVTLAGGGTERYSPRFTFFGGRYLSVTATAPVKIRSLVSVPVTSIRREDERGALEVGHPLVNRLVRNVEWGMYSNYLSTPTDCPQRDERLGWTADTDVFAKTAMYRADVKDFLAKYLADLRDGVDANGVYPAVAPVAFIGPQRFKFGWTDAGVLVTHKLWWRYGDCAVVDENWAAMARYVRFVGSFGGRTVFGKDWQYADWLSFENYESHMDGSRDPKGFEGWWNYLGGCYLLMDAEAMAEMARATGRQAEAAEFGQLAADTRARLKKDFFAADGLVDARYRGLQCAHVFALKCGLVEDVARKETVASLVRLIEANGNRLSTGFLGTAFLLDVLSENGRVDVAYTLLLQQECPSWLFPVTQGATTSWERWNSYTKKDGLATANMNSFNHYAFGSVMGWIYETAAGIRPLEPGYRRYAIDPKPDPRLGSLKASFVTPQGKRLRVRWSYGADGACTVEKGEEGADADANGRPPAKTVRLMSFNIRMGCGHDDPFQLAKGSLGHLPQCAEVVRAVGPDAVGLQEVDRNSQRAGFMDQTAEMAKLCGLHGEWVEKTPDYGISLLSRQKPLSVEKVLMKGSLHTRALMICEFADYFVANTHFPLAEWACTNAAAVVRGSLRERAKRKPVFLMGDFNSEPDSATMRAIREDFTVLSDEGAFTWPARRPDRTIDYILVDRAHADAVRLVSRRVIAAPGATDHAALVVDVEIR